MAMVKIVDPRGWDWERPVAQQIKLARAGLRGADRRAFIKLAGATAPAFLDVIDKVKFAADEEPVHLIAMGATEQFSANRNGDGFKSAMLKRCHDTFVKHGRPYRNHANRDPKVSFGVVKASAYNEAMHRVELLVGYNASKAAAERNGGLVADKELEKLARGEDLPVSMAVRVPHDVCLRGDMLIETERGLTAISDVCAGVRVRTEDGTLQSVVQTFKRAYVGTVVELEALGALQPIYATANHPIRIMREAVVRQCHGTTGSKRRRHTLRYGSGTCTSCDTAVSATHEWVTADEIKVGDYLVYPVQEPGAVAVATELAYLFGFYIGDGSLVGERRRRDHSGPYRTYGISVTLDYKWPAIKNRVLAAAKELHGRTQPLHSAGADKQAWQTAIYHRKLAAVCRRGAGKYFDQKQLASWIFDWDRESRLHLLGGLLDSDGSVDATKQAGRICVCNRYLAYQIQRLFWGLGLTAAYHEEERRGTWVTDSSKPVSVVSLSVQTTAALRNYSVKAAALASTVRWSSERSFVLDGYMHLRVQSVYQHHDELDVYNLQVAGNETYVAGGCVVHNCSSCGNKARTRDEYCTEDTCVGPRGEKRGGCKHNLTKLCADGHLLHVDNPDGVFFDISHVFRPADRIAYGTRADWLAKAAAHEFPGGAALAEALAVSAPLSVCLAQDDPLDQSLAVRAQFKLAHALAQLSAQEPGLTPQALRALDPRVRTSFSDAQLALLGRPGTSKAASALAALADRKIVLGLGDFARWTKRAAAASSAAEQLAGIFTRLVSSSRCIEKLAANPWQASDATSPAQRALASGCFAGASLDSEALAERAMRFELRRLSAPVLKTAFIKSAAADPQVLALAEDYALYQLAALQRIAGFDTAFNLTARLAVGQNRF